jgi:Coenzyme PQQ synthesis protein D (PqqD)
VVDLETRVVRRSEPLTAEVDGETVMFHPDAGSYFALGTVGTRVWDLIAEPRSVGDVCATLRAEFDVDEEACREQVLAFVREMHEKNLVEAHT